MKKLICPFAAGKILFIRFVFIVLLAPVVLGFGSAGAGEVVDRIVAVVNDDIIRLKELDKAVERFEAQIRSQGFSRERESEEIYKIRMDVLNNLIDEKLAEQEIRNSGIFVDEREVDNAIEQVKAMNYYSDEDLRSALTANGVSMDEYREEIKRQILRNKLVNIKIKSNIIITESDIADYYEKNLDKYAPKETYLLRNILMTYPVSMSNQAREKVYARMQDVYERLEEGALFTDMAQEYSEAMNAADGGRLGRFSIDELAENIADAVKSLTSGEFSPITETDQGFQIFFVEQIEETGGRTRDEMSDEIRQLLYEESVNEKFQSWIEHLREDAHIQIIR